MIKIRIMGTREELTWWKYYLESRQDIEIIRMSKPFKNKGTSRFFRMYVEIESEESRKLACPAK